MNSGADLLWQDEFDTGTELDSAFWRYDLGATGWGNSELQEYTRDPANVRVENGTLVIEVHEAQTEGSRQFTSARVKTENRLTFLYGTLEARIKVPDVANGLWPAFWTLGDNISEVGWPACGELDVLELGSAAAIAEAKVRNRVTSTAHWEHGGSHASYGLAYDSPGDLNDDFHVYRMEWTPQSVSTYIDGKPIWSFDISSESCADCTEFHEPHFVIVNLAVGGSYPALYSAEDISARIPAKLEADYIRIYNNGYTRLGGSSQVKTTSEERGDGSYEQ